MEIIVPAAGLSTRFPNMKPKYLLFGYDGRMMLETAIAPYMEANCHITVGLLEQHNKEYRAGLFVANELPFVGQVMFKSPTRGPAATVYHMLQHEIEFDTLFDPAKPFMVKDCDSFFNHNLQAEGNYVCVSKISDHKVLKRLAAKSFCVYNDQKMITSIVEKNVVSDHFCVGGYRFESANAFIHAYNTLMATEPTHEIFVSHVIQWMIMKGTHFHMEYVTDYVDVGTAEDWFEYNDRPVIFCDVDGTLVHAQSRYGSNSYESEPKVIQENVDLILAHQAHGAQIVFTTARPKEYENITSNMLKSLGFRDFILLVGLNNAGRILINDYNDSTPFPRAEAINIRRDANNLSDFLKKPVDK